MENVTIELPDDLARWAEARAAENGRSAPEWIAAQLESMRRCEDEYDVAMNRLFGRARKPRRLEWVDGRKPTREELHDRADRR